MTHTKRACVSGFRATVVATITMETSADKAVTRYKDFADEDPTDGGSCGRGMKWFLCHKYPRHKYPRRMHSGGFKIRHINFHDG